ncbi:hypothetical protein LWF01_10880 [Saxibacter everestensis]|uniref:Fucose isomerase n=1 Tax=Saxibacter everestensis TaxID=2909229 RepID=A0ABY8QP94_9MICO|nr:hypothetical protein LWF01_10880 [Brevibacteriaceae bacterium ZFBP1038]
MTKPRVLQIGMDPDVIDFSPWPGQDADKLRARIGDAEAALRSAGFDVAVCLVPSDVEAAESAVREHFAAGTFDLVEIGSGMRTSHEFTPIFERVVNTVTALQSGVRFCFNDSPESTLDAVRRGLTP